VPTKPLIAIVDDDESVRLALQSLIRSLGLAARVFASAADFLASRDMPRVSCLILDIHMPGMSGLAIPTILVTGNADDATRAEALRQGVICYLCKPFADDDLLAWVNVALGRATP
jgi:FixJ family two-component response regulator